jgi:hypothetical protein
MRHRIALIAGLLLVLGAFAPNALAGTTHTETFVHVFVDCVTQSSGTYDATFGYKNDNSTAQTVVVGTDNYFTPPPIDRGQTTSFQPGTVHNAFTVKAIPNATKLTWTVSLNGHTESVRVSSSSSHACTAATPAIHVSVDCVTRGADTYDATFAYVNDGPAAQTVPVGTENYFAPPPIDRGQTTVFQPGSHHAAFTVKGIPNATRLTWTVASRSTTAGASGRSCTPATTGVIHIYIDCVTKSTTTYDATFAYANDNAAAQTVPVGSDNFFSPPPIDRGQVTTFQPGLHHAAFTVTGIPIATKLTWTVAFGGSTRTVSASTNSRSCTPTVKRVEVFVDCVTRNAGSYDATFGYENDNAAAQTVPVGTDNYFSPPPIDRGQTSTFQPGKVHGAFTVKGIPSGTKLTWTVNSGGRSDRVTASESGRQCVTTTPPPKVTICHKTDGKRQWVQITVDAKSVARHLRHGDVMPSSTGCPAPKKKHHHKHHGESSKNQVRQEKRH